MKKSELMKIVKAMPIFILLIFSTTSYAGSIPLINIPNKIYLTDNGVAFYVIPKTKNIMENFLNKRFHSNQNESFKEEDLYPFTQYLNSINDYDSLQIVSEDKSKREAFINYNNTISDELNSGISLLYRTTQRLRINKPKQRVFKFDTVGYIHLYGINKDIIGYINFLYKGDVIAVATIKDCKDFWSKAREFE